MEILALVFCKKVHHFDSDDNLLVGAGKDGIFAEVDTILINLQAVPGGGDEETMLGWIVGFVLFVFFLANYHLNIYKQTPNILVFSILGNSSIKKASLFVKLIIFLFLHAVE